MTTSIGSGIGGFVAVAAQPTYGATVVTPTRSPSFRSFKPTNNPHPVQGGPWLADGNLFNYGTGRVLTWLDAQATLSGDMVNTGEALLVRSALGSGSTMTQLGTTTAYELGGASGSTASAADKNGAFFDLQAGVPTDDATLHPFTFHSGVITKATWVFERGALVTKEYEMDFQYVEAGTTALVSPTEPAGPVPFTMVNNGGGTGTTSVFLLGAYGSEAFVSGVRKATIVLEHPMKTDRIYNGAQYKKMPVSNDLIKISVALDTDYDSDAKTAIYDLQLAGTPTSLICSSVGNAIGSSSHNDTFQINVSNMFADTGGEAPLDGPDLVKNTINFSGTINAAANPAFSCVLISGDTTF